MDTLRSLRLWHWRKVLSFRAVAVRHEAAADEWERLYPGKVNRHNRTMARNAHKNANRHLGAVQALNDCFPVGDTAEQDAAREDAAKEWAQTAARFTPHPPEPADP